MHADRMQTLRAQGVNSLEPKCGTHRMTAGSAVDIANGEPSLRQASFEWLKSVLIFSLFFKSCS